MEVRIVKEVRLEIVNPNDSCDVISFTPDGLDLLEDAVEQMSDNNLSTKEIQLHEDLDYSISQLARWIRDQMQ